MLALVLSGQVLCERSLAQESQAGAGLPRVLPAAGDFAPRAPAKPLSRQAEAALRPGDVFRECDACPLMIVVPAGRFVMGAPEEEAESAERERPQRAVEFAKPFAVGIFPVTFEEWDACAAGRGCAGYRPADQGWGRGRQPAINLNWHDASAYAWWLAQKTGQPYRLPSEAEREYVTRAGTRTPFWWGAQASPSRANYDGKRAYDNGPTGEYRGRPVAVDAFAPNPWGLYQVHGNLSEWVEDCWNPTYRGAPADGSAWRQGDCSMRVVRGGAWSRTPSAMRAASRVAFGTDMRMQYLGLRVARTLRTARH